MTHSLTGLSWLHGTDLQRHPLQREMFMIDKVNAIVPQSLNYSFTFKDFL